MTTQKQTAHTPGPWHVKDASGGRPAIVFAEDGYPICDCKTFHGQHKEGQDEYNARLIAAAPDMLDVLEKISAYLMTKPYGNAEDASVVFDRMRDAIALATTGSRGGAG